MRELFHIHWMALHPVKVLGIVLGIVLSFGAIEVVGQLANQLPPADEFPLLRHWSMFEQMVAHGRVDLIALIAAWMCLVWAVLGGAATRRMTLDVQGGARENFSRSLWYCCKWPLAFPSALAVGCFFFILLARPYPWLLLFLLPVWLYAGLYYGALTLENIRLSEAAAKVHSGLARWREALRLQFFYLISFGISTGVVYLLALGYALSIRLAVNGRNDLLFASWSWLELALIVPVLTYALGYTTSNLKSLQVFLYTKMYLDHDSSKNSRGLLLPRLHPSTESPGTLPTPPVAGHS